MTEPAPLQQVKRTYVRQRGRTLSYFGGCDYFRLGSHPAVLAAVREGLGRYGLNVAVSRLYRVPRFQCKPVMFTHPAWRPHRQAGS